MSAPHRVSVVLSDTDKARLNQFAIDHNETLSGAIRLLALRALDADLSEGLSRQITRAFDDILETILPHIVDAAIIARNTLVRQYPGDERAFEMARTQVMNAIKAQRSGLKR